MKLVFATNNRHKIEEMGSILGKEIELVTLGEIGCHDDIPETADTLEGNALIKARYINQKYGVNCFADDTGLEVESLDGEPGVYSARYAGESNNPKANIEKLLQNLTEKNNRHAQFRTVIALIINGKEFLFEGIVKGEIAKEELGEAGFGYDPIFIPQDYTQSFAQMSAKEKNIISHRGKAAQKLSEYLKTK